MKETIVRIPWDRDFILKETVTNERRKRWTESIRIARNAKENKFTNIPEIFWSDVIDMLADVKLQIMNQED